MKRIGLWLSVGVTAAYILVILVFFGSDAWTLRPNELGDFLAGLFTPLAFLWLVIGYFMQRTELGLQREELKHQREELALTRDKLGEQVELLKQQVEADHQRTLPRLKLEKGNISSGEQKWRIRNSGAIAKELIVLKDDVEQSSFPQLDSDKNIDVFSIPTHGGACSFYCEARFTSGDHESFRQLWEIKRTGEEKPSFKPVKEVTDGPEPLEG